MKDIATNKKALYEYEIFEKIEAGIELLGAEVKSARLGQVSLADSYAIIREGELFLLNAYFAPYKKAMTKLDPRRTRKLLLHKKEVARLAGKLKERGLSLVPLRMYFRHNVLKVELGLGKGKKKYEKREALKKKEAEREIKKAIIFSL